MRAIVMLTLLGVLFVPSVIANVIKNVVKPELVLRHPGRKVHWVSVRDDDPAKMSNVPWSIRKHVIVARPSPKIEEFPPLLNINEVLRADGGSRIWGEAALSRAFGANEPRSGLIVFRENEIERHGVVAQFAIGPHLQIARRRIPTILPHRPESPIVMLGTVRFPESGETICENEGLFICNQRLPCQIGLSSSSSPKGRGECGDDYRGQRGDRPVIRVYEATGALDIGADRAKESGWVFFGGAAGVLCLMLGKALLEAWRKKSLTRNKGAKKD
jgi:hypothetical protein